MRVSCHPPPVWVSPPEFDHARRFGSSQSGSVVYSTTANKLVSACDHDHGLTSRSAPFPAPSLTLNPFPARVIRSGSMSVAAPLLPPPPPPPPHAAPSRWIDLFDFALVVNPTSTRACPSIHHSLPPFVNTHDTCPADDPQKVVKVVASDGKTGDQCELSYTNCKVVGNGSFGVVFQAKLVGGNLSHDQPGDDDVAIKKVLQDKRFKVRWRCRTPDRACTAKSNKPSMLTFDSVINRIVNCKS